LVPKIYRYDDFKKNTFVVQRRIFLFLLIASTLLVTCKKTTIINNYITNPENYGSGLVLTPAATYASIPTAILPPSSGGSLSSSYFIEIPNISFNQGHQGFCASCASAMAKSIVDHVENSTAYPNNEIIYSTKLT
jgi:hypothetical protein